MPIYQLPKELWFPSVKEAEEGIVAVGGDLTPERLLLAYQSGIFPWYDENDPIIWWSPNPRLILIPEEFKVSKSLKASIRNKGFLLKIDENFEEVIQNCAFVKRKEEEGTWITNEMTEAYVNLHKLGIAHSFEIFQNDQLVGGLYGVSLGKVFFGESMFTKVSDASKVALYYLVEFAKKNAFHFIDSQVETSHLISLGAKNIARDEFIERLDKALEHEGHMGKWKL